MIGETILAGTSGRCKEAYNWRDNISLIIGLQSASWWSVNIYCANCWPTIGAPIIVPPILARSSAVFFNSANPTWDILFLEINFLQFISGNFRADESKKIQFRRIADGEPSLKFRVLRFRSAILNLTHLKIFSSNLNSVMQKNPRE